MEKIFGYSYSGRRFREILRLSPAGLVFKSKSRYDWREVVAYRAYPDFYPDLILAAIGSAKPQITFYLRDGRLIAVRGDILALDETAGDGTNAKAVFADLLHEVRERAIPKWQGPREERILYVTAFTLFLVAAFVGIVVSQLVQPAADIKTHVGIGVLIGGLIGQSAFLLAPLIGRRLRRLYILGTAYERGKPAA